MNHFPYILLLLIGIYFIPVTGIAQTPNTTAEQQLEAITESYDDAEIQDDSFWQQLQQFIKSPLNLNIADEASLKELVILSPFQIQSLLSYHRLLGNFISIYELQAVPGWDIATIEKLRPYITVSMEATIISSFGERLSGGTHVFLARATQVLEKSKGYLMAPSPTANYYLGSPQRYFIRYKYYFKNLLQFGVTADKDAGEEFFQGTQKQGFDFYSVHFFARDIGIIKSFALGDFTVNMGQGLTQWQSLAFKKSSDVLNIKRQLSVLRPYSSAGEINFNRGAGITLAKKYAELTAFISYRKVDANAVTDTLDSDEQFISSLQTSGLHRTKSEVADKGVQRQFSYGGNFAFNKNGLHVGVNVIQYHFKLPVNKGDDPYNLYALSGKHYGNQSVDYSYTFRNLHFFGEAASDHHFNKAFVNGLLMSVDAAVDLSFVYRNISSQYQSLYSNAFTESTYPVNEKGFYAGISIRPHTAWRIDAYADFYKFPWLRYQVDAPSVGTDYLTQATYKPNKQLEVYVRYRWESKAKNYNPFDSVLSQVLPKPRQNLRTQINYRVNTALVVRNRFEWVWYDGNGGGKQNGFLSFVDFLYKPMLKKYAANIRLQYFKTGGYDSRIYAYENDVMFSYSIPAFYDNGYHYYFNLNYDLTRKLSGWVRWSQSIYRNKNTIGSGLDEIDGNKKTEIKIQLQYIF